MVEQYNGSRHSTEPKVIFSFKTEPMHVLALEWDRNNNSLAVSSVTNSTITKNFKQCFVFSLMSIVHNPIGIVALFNVCACLFLNDIRCVNDQI